MSFFSREKAVGASKEKEAPHEWIGVVLCVEAVRRDMKGHAAETHRPDAMAPRTATLGICEEVR
ncbi:hypothetical protein JIQ42_00493 [Leishmania sp. Namibia]|uniref:hypothetical protein n=1 Tax=Leishmania sp. Namibia TaxID=2802991 RepID=UPI001B56776C|nr:hypothetical protein JIQ42_00493 [Leishmania sp. Namibia]